MKADLSPPLRHTARSPPFIHIDTKGKTSGTLGFFSLQAPIMTNTAHGECVCLHICDALLRTDMGRFDLCLCSCHKLWRADMDG